MADIELIKELRELTGVSVAKIKQALEEAEGIREKALEKLKELGGAIAAKKADRELKAGLIEAYVHNGQIGVLAEVSCETDFVARNEQFKALAKDLALHAAALRPSNAAEMLEQPFVKDQDVTIKELIEQSIAKLGENIQLTRISILALGE